MPRRAPTFKELETVHRKLRGYEKGRLSIKNAAVVEFDTYRGILKLIKKERKKLWK